MKLVKHTLYTLLFLCFTTATLKAQQSFQPLLKFKAVNDKTVKMRLVPRDYFEFKAIGNTGLKIEINTLGPKSGATTSFKGSKKTIIYDTLSISEWKAKKMTPQLAIVSQLLQGKPQMYGATLTEQIANAKKIQDNTFIMALLGSSFSWDAAIASRTGIELPLSADSIYLVRVSLLRNTPYAINDSAQVFANYVGNNPQKEEIALPYFSAEGMEKQVQLFWPENEEYLAYHIQTSNTDGTGTTLLTNTPYFNQNKDSIQNDWIYSVSVEQNYVPKRYRLLGFDLFGDSSNYSPWITAFGKDKTPPQSVSKIRASSVAPEHARVSWEMPIDSEREKIVVYYSHSDEKPEEKIAEIAKTDTVFVHNKADNILPNYYWVFTQDTAGNLGGEFPISVVTYDTFPPQAPEISLHTIDSNGLVTLNWNRLNEPDVHGYKVGIVRGKESKATPITLNETVILDTIFQEILPPKKIQGAFSYAVRAKDLKGNYGPWSTLKPITIPDVIPPSFVQIESLTPNEDGTLSLHLNLPRDEDAVGLRIRRIIDAKDTGDWVSQALSSTITDKEVSRKHRYQYLVQTVDKAGNHSVSAISPIKSPFPKVVNTDAVKLGFSVTKSHQIELQISNIPKGIKTIRLFKSTGVEPFYEIGQIDRERLTYRSEKLPLYTVHRYGILFEDEEGNKSKRMETEAIYIKEMK